MKKALLLIPLLLLVGCGNNVEVAQPPIVTIDGEVIYKYEDKDLFQTVEYYLVAEVEYPQVQTYDVKVSEYIYNYYEIGDTIQFALKG